MKKNMLTILALVCALSLVLCGCGSSTSAETTVPATTEAPVITAPLGFSQVKLTTSTWSSPNGATVHLNAVPEAYAEGLTVDFLVRLGEEEVANIPCIWDGTAYTADAELNAANGFSYALLVTDTTDMVQEFPLEASDALVNMATGLESYCNLLVDETAYADNELTISQGTVNIQTPQITNAGETITVEASKLLLTFGGETVSEFSLDLAAGETVLSGVSLGVPALENDQQVVLSLQVILSNGYVLQDEGGVFFYDEGALVSAVG